MTRSQQLLVSALMSQKRVKGGKERAKALVIRFNLQRKEKAYCVCSWLAKRTREYVYDKSCVCSSASGIDHQVYSIDDNNRRIVILQPYDVREDILAVWAARQSFELVNVGKAYSPYWPGKTECLVLIGLSEQARGHEDRSESSESDPDEVNFIVKLANRLLGKPEVDQN